MLSGVSSMKLCILYIVGKTTKKIHSNDQHAEIKGLSDFNNVDHELYCWFSFM